jgi:hypothetical protein
MWGDAPAVGLSVKAPPDRVELRFDLVIKCVLVNRKKIADRNSEHNSKIEKSLVERGRSFRVRRPLAAPDVSHGEINISPASTK